MEKYAKIKTENTVLGVMKVREPEKVEPDVKPKPIRRRKRKTTKRKRHGKTTG